MRTETRKIRIKKEFSGKVFLVYKNRQIEIGAGGQDYIDLCYYDKDFTMVINSNPSLDYIGAELINVKTMEKYHEVFFQNVEELKESFNLKKDIWEYTSNSLGDMLANWLY